MFPGLIPGFAAQLMTTTTTLFKTVWKVWKLRLSVTLQISNQSTWSSAAERGNDSHAVWLIYQH